MRRILWIAIFLIASLTSTGIAQACDICGCGAGNNYIGILPEFQKHIVGFRFRSNGMRTHVGVGGANSYLTTSETYNTLELWAGWNIAPRLRLMASAPYAFNERIQQGTTRRKSGPGDISMSAYYELLNTRNTTSGHLWVHSLWIGGGIKLPTGTYDPMDKNASGQNANLFQLGTASTDLSLHAMYDLRVQDAGLNLNAAYKINTTNRYDYRYGNKFSGAAQLYHKLRLHNNWQLAPNAGVQYERSAQDNDDGWRVDMSGGHVVLGTIGLEMAFGRCSLGANYQTPLHQNLAAQLIHAQNRAMIHCSLNL